jgi:hypothetical protein
VEINIRPTTVRDNSLDLDNIDVPLYNVQVVGIPVRGVYYVLITIINPGGDFR